VIVTINGGDRTIGEGATVLAVLALLDADPDARGVAVAVDSEVVPRREWATRTLAPGARVEVLVAIQGG
jgi:sulfur carrier protein